MAKANPFLIQDAYVQRHDHAHHNDDDGDTDGDDDDDDNDDDDDDNGALKYLSPTHEHRRTSVGHMFEAIMGHLYL